MNKSSLFPFSVYGKSGKTGPIPEGYKWHYVDDKFPKEAFEKADECARSFQWLSWNELDQYEPVLCWIPGLSNHEDGLFLRFMDVGKDDRKRPHTLRIEAYYIHEKYIKTDPDIPLGLFFGSNIFDCDDIDFKSGEWKDKVKNQIQSLKNALNEYEINILSKCILLANEPICFRFKVPYPLLALSKKSLKPIDINEIVYNTNSYNDSKKQYRDINNQNKSQAHNKINKTKKNRLTKYFILFLLLFCFSSAGFNYYQYNKIEKLDKKVLSLNNDLTENKNADDKIQELNERVEILEKALEKLLLKPLSSLIDDVDVKRAFKIIKNKIKIDSNNLDASDEK